MHNKWNKNCMMNGTKIAQWMEQQIAQWKEQKLHDERNKNSTMNGTKIARWMEQKLRNEWNKNCMMNGTKIAWWMEQKLYDECQGRSVTIFTGGGVTSKFYRRTRGRSSGEKYLDTRLYNIINIYIRNLPLYTYSFNASCFNVYFPDKHLRSHEFSEGEAIVTTQL